MSTIRFITFTDVHISDHNPQSRLGNYKKDILEKLKQIGTLGNALKVDFYLCGGDLYEHKAPTRNSHELNVDLIKIFKEFGKPIYMTEGNHDIRNDSYENFSNQPLNVLYESRALTQLRNETVTKGSLKVALRAFEFEETPDLEAYGKPNKDVDCSVCILHIYSKPEGGMLFKQKMFSYKDISVLGDDIFLMGHYHKDQGIVTVNYNGYDQHFINVGAISRGSHSDDNVSRAPKIGFVEIKKDSDGKVHIKTKQVRLSVQPASDIFDIEKKEIEQKRVRDAEEFVEELQKTVSVDNDSGAGLNDVINHLDLESEVMKKVDFFIKEAEREIGGLK